MSGFVGSLMSIRLGRGVILWLGNRVSFSEKDVVEQLLTGFPDLYLPSYFHTEKHTVFVGEHTSYTHAWIWSALESAVRGTTQLLLDMGLVDEAKEITEFWMARWISV